jgi:hypothetical protein
VLEFSSKSHNALTTTTTTTTSSFGDNDSGSVLDSAADTIDAVFQSLGTMDLPDWSSSQQDKGDSGQPAPEKSKGSPAALRFRVSRIEHSARERPRLDSSISDNQSVHSPASLTTTSAETPATGWDSLLENVLDRVLSQSHYIDRVARFKQSFGGDQASTASHEPSFSLVTKHNSWHGSTAEDLYAPLAPAKTTERRVAAGDGQIIEQGLQRRFGLQLGIGFLDR